MRKVRVYCFFLIFIGLNARGYGQYNTSIGKISIASPNAASLGKFGDIPVSYHTGIPDVSIPVYTIKTGTLELPITLNYHASGLKVQEQASWVGAGWALEAGGVITRTVIDAPDDRGLYGYSTDKGHFSDYGYNSYLFTSGPSSCAALPYVCPIGRSGMTPSIYAPQDYYFSTGKFDGEPDLYFFNFNGHSGKFYFNDDRTPVIVPEQDLKITPIYPGDDWRGITGFIITTPDGTRYYFGKNQIADGNIDAIEETYNASTQNSYVGQGATSSWYLNKIMSADSQFSITLTYVVENYSYYSLSMFPIPSVRNPNIFAYNLAYDLDKNFINGVRLSKINFADGEVNFTPGSLRQDLSFGNTYTALDDLPNSNETLGGRTLGSISIKTGDFCKKDSFYTSYFYDPSQLTGSLFTQTYTNLNLTSDKYRLRLDSIQETTCDRNITLPPYKFDYFDGAVPRKLSFGIDHWGFYNGVTSNQDLIPTYTVNLISHPGANRDAAWPAMEGGALRKITYPTGGTTAFEFEPNSIFTSVTSVISDAWIANLVLLLYGQDSQFTQTVSFTSNGNPVTINFNNTSNYSATFSIRNSSNVIVYSNSNVSNNSNYSVPLTLPQGDYQATATLPQYSNTNPGLQVILTQNETVTNSGNITVGGLRIKSITRQDALTTNDIVTNYNYNFDNETNGHSSGILFGRPVYVQALRNDVWATVDGANCSISGCFTCFGSDASYYQSPSSIRPMSSTQGNHIGYGEVYVSQQGNGYTQYKYYSSNGSLVHSWDTSPEDVCERNLNTFCDPNLPNSPAPPEPFDPMRGQLAFQAQYNQNGQMIRSSTYFPQFKMDSLITPGIIHRFFVTGYMIAGAQGDALSIDPLNNVPVNGFVPIGVSTFTEYYLQSAKKVMDSVMTVRYDPITSKYLTDINTTYYGSKYHSQPTKILTISSKGEKIVTNFKNAFDFRISNFNVPDQLSTYYTNIAGDNDYLSSTIAGITDPSDPYYYWDRLNVFMNYRYMKAIDRQTYINYRRQNFTDPGNVYDADHESALASADNTLKPVLKLQDEYINAPIEISKWRDQNLTSASFTKYEVSSSPQGYAYPDRSQQINLQSPSSSFLNATVSGNTLSLDGRYQDESIFQFKDGNLKQITPHDGISTSYVWGYINTEPVAQVTNASPDQIAFSSFESDGTGNWNYNVNRPLVLGSVTGSKCLDLNNVDGSSISKTGLVAGKDYVVSYWSLNGPYAITGGSNNTRTGRSALNGWTYYEHSIHATSTTITLTGIGKIDELRLYPKGAQMTSYTYFPHTGLTSMDDPNGEITYYEYDGLGRLKNVKDYQGNIIKNYQYNYQGSCGPNCSVLAMQTFNATNTLSYPVGVFNVNGKLLGNATNQTQYISTWMADTANTHTGTIVAGDDSMHFKFTVNPGKLVPPSLTGCRYYQYDISDTIINAVTNSNGCYVDFGDGNAMRLGNDDLDTIGLIIPPNTRVFLDGVAFFVHNYSSSVTKTITLYHNDVEESPYFNSSWHVLSNLAQVTNVRGNFPQYMKSLYVNEFTQPSAQSVSNIYNWSTISSIEHFGGGTNMGYTPNFMENNIHLKTVSILNGTAKLSLLKSDWNLQFRDLKSILIRNKNWDLEDLSHLPALSYFGLLDSDTPLITSAEADSVYIQVARGSGQTIPNGQINIDPTTGIYNTPASYQAVNYLFFTKGWLLYWNQGPPLGLDF